MTIPDEQRKYKLNFTIHIFQKVKECGNTLFISGNSFIEAQKEFVNAIVNKQIGVIIPDNRQYKSGSNLCLFVSSLNELIVLPIMINIDIGVIDIINMLPAKEGKNHREWFYNQYLQIAETRNMPIIKCIY